MMLKIFLFVLLCSTSYTTFSQESGKIYFSPQFREEPIELHKRYLFPDSNWIEFSILKFYVSDLVFVSTEGRINEITKYHLVDLDDTNSLILTHSSQIQEALSFNIGIDSLTNVSGILEGPLDPINGMYWAWNSGYINFKIEGKSSISSNADKSFEFHLGGYAAPFATIQEVLLLSNSTDNDVVIEIELHSFLSKIDLEEINSIMIPGNNAVQISSILPAIFNRN